MNPFKQTTSRHIASAALGLSLAFASTSKTSAESLFRFEFNEGTGETISNVGDTLTGTFGSYRNLDPANYPQIQDHSPSGAEGDKSLEINGAQGYLQMDGTGADPLYDFTKPLTVEGWVYIPADATQRNEAFIGFGGVWKFGFRANGQITFTMFAVRDIESGLFPPAVEAWFHMAAVWEPGVGVRYFVDGVELAFLEETREMRLPVHNFLGIGSTGNGEPINAILDRVRLHQAALTAEELDSVATEPKAPLPSTLVAFDFDEGESSFTNEGTIGRTAAPPTDLYYATSIPQFTEDAPSGLEGDTALLLDGNDAIVVDDPTQVVTLDETQNFTIQAWLKPGVQPTPKGVFFLNNGLGGAISAAITTAGNVMVTTLGRADTTTEAVFPNDGLWHHLGIIHENGVGYRIYIDGILEATTPYTAGVLMDTRTDTFFMVGSEPAARGYNGAMDRLEVFNEAIDPADLDFLAIPGVDPGAPELEIKTAVEISWPTVATGFILQSTTDLNEPRVWVDVAAPTAVIDDRISVLVRASEEETFYRLVRPTSDE